MTAQEHHKDAQGMSFNEEEIRGVLRGLKIGEIEVLEGVAKCSLRGVLVAITAEEIRTYNAFKLADKQISETSIFSEGYFEQAIEVHGHGPNAYRLFRENRAIALKHEQSGFIIEISPISSNFIMSMTDSDEMNKDFKRIYSLRGGMVNRGKQELTLSEFFSRVLTVKVISPASHPFRKNLKQLRLIAEAGLYHISFGNGVGLVAIKSWERSFFHLSSSRAEAVQFPLQVYNQEIVAYYQMALGAESLVLSYLALYKILEYFYTNASEHILHKKIKDHLLAPDFSHTKVGKLRDLAKTIRAFDNKMNEKVMLQTVLDQHIDKDGLRAWVEKFDEDNGAHFTVEQEVFGKASRIDLSENQLFATVSARIYQIRNALVHNKEGEESRFTPFSGQERILIKEAPLLLRISEELIQKTGKDLQL